jgi:hypothetical protein
VGSTDLQIFSLRGSVSRAVRYQDFLSAINDSMSNSNADHTGTAGDAPYQFADKR